MSSTPQEPSSSSSRTNACTTCGRSVPPEHGRCAPCLEAELASLQASPLSSPLPAPLVTTCLLLLGMGVLMLLVPTFGGDGSFAQLELGSTLVLGSVIALGFDRVCALLRERNHLLSRGQAGGTARD